MTLARFGWPEFGHQFGRRSVPPSVLSEHYGTGLGQIPLHLDPARAVVSGGVVTSVPNSGGAGPAFNGTITGPGFTRSGNLLSVNAITAAAALAAPADLVGVRLFAILAPADAATTSYRVFGHPDSSSIRINPTDMSIWTADTGITTTFSGLSPIETLSLIELELVGGVARLWRNGALIGTQARTGAAFPLSSIGRGSVGGLQYVGLMGDILSMATDGSAAMDARAAQIRAILAAKHGITLA